MSDPTDEPLIYTAKGNLPVKDLRIEPHWRHAPGEWVALSVRYYLGEELVREDGHQFVFKGLTAESVAAPIG